MLTSLTRFLIGFAVMFIVMLFAVLSFGALNHINRSDKMFKKGFQMSWWYQLFAFAVIILSAFASIFFGNNTENSPLSLLSDFCLIIPCAVGYAALKKGCGRVNLSDDLGIRAIKPEYILYIIFMPVFYHIFCIHMTMPLTMGLNLLFGSDTPDIEVPKNSIEFITTLTSLCILAPALEEFIYRGVMVRFMKGYSFQTVMLTTSLAFTMMHLDMSSFVQIFFLGMFLFLLRMSTGSIFSSMAAHSIINLMLFMLMMIYQSDTSAAKLESLLLAVEFGSLIIMPFLMINFLRATVDNDDDWTKKICLKGHKTGVSAACIIFTVIYIIWNIGILADNIESGYTKKAIDELFSDNVIIEEETVN